MGIRSFQNLRDKLWKRFERLSHAQIDLYIYGLEDLWRFINDQPIIQGIIEDLTHRFPEAQNKANEFTNREMDFKKIFGVGEDKFIPFLYFLLKECVSSRDAYSKIREKFRHLERDQYKLKVFNSSLIEPLIAYIDEHLNDSRAILSLLRRYKHRCEWFQREDLFDSQESKPEKAEKNLTLDLYEYLYEQGLEFQIEPDAIIGKPDLIAAQNTKDPLVADAKIFDGDKRHKSYLAKGFGQIYRYTEQYNEPFGYLIIFKICQNDLSFSLTNQTQYTPYIIHNNKTIFLITIDIYPHKEPASKRGKLKTYDITEKYLVEYLESEENEG